MSDMDNHLHYHTSGNFSAKKGSTGPTGPTGRTGRTGPTGPAGKVSVITASNLNINSSFVSKRSPLWLIGCQNNYYNIISSRDGSNWSVQQNQLGNGFITSLNYASSIWIATTNARINNTTTTQTSLNGNNWSNVTRLPFNEVYDIIYASNMWVAVGEHNRINSSIQYSYNGSNWSNASTQAYGSYAVTYGSNMWVAVGSYFNPGTSTIQYSYDGMNWSNTYGGFGNEYGKGVAYGSNMWVVVGKYSEGYSTIQYSYDGMNWSNAGGGFGSNQGYGVAYGSNMWVAVGRQSEENSTIQYSYDGMNWSNTRGTFNLYGTQVTYKNNMWVATGANNESNVDSPIKYSRNGIDWFNINNWSNFKNSQPNEVNFGLTPSKSNANGIFMGPCSINLNEQNVLTFANANQSVAFTDFLMNSLNAFNNVFYYD